MRCLDGGTGCGRRAAAGDARAAARACACARRRGARAGSGADRQPLRSDLASDGLRRPVHQRGRRPRAFSALPGSPERSRAQRRAVRARGSERRVAVPRHRRPRGLPRSEIHGQLRARREVHHQGPVGPDSAVLQRGHGDPVREVRRRAGPARCDAAGDSERSGDVVGVHSAVAAVRSHRAARHRDRQLHRHADAADGRQRGVHEHPPSRRAPVGRVVRLFEQRRGRAAVRLAHERPDGQHRVEERSRFAARLVQRQLVQQSRPDARLRQSARIDRLDIRAGRRPDVAVADQFRADGEHDRLHEVSAQDAADGHGVYRVLEQRFAAAAVHDQLRAAAADAAARRHAGRSARRLGEPGYRLAAAERLAAQREAAHLQLRQPDARDVHPAVRVVRHVGQHVHDGRSAVVRAQPPELRRGRHVQRPRARRSHVRLHAQQRRLRRADLRQHRRERRLRVRRCRRHVVDDVPGAGTNTATASGLR